jgi:hypothetical protein
MYSSGAPYSLDPVWQVTQECNSILNENPRKTENMFIFVGESSCVKMLVTISEKKHVFRNSLYILPNVILGAQRENK